MKMTKKSIIFIILLAVFIIFITPIKSNANSAKNISNTKNFTEYTIKVSSLEDLINYNPGKTNDGDAKIVANKIGPILNAITTIGMVLGVLVIIILGIKYMIGSVEEKAELKKTMMPYLIGAIMITGVTGILKLFSGLISDILS